MFNKVKQSGMQILQYWRAEAVVLPTAEITENAAELAHEHWWEWGPTLRVCCVLCPHSTAAWQAPWVFPFCKWEAEAPRGLSCQICATSSECEHLNSRQTDCSLCVHCSSPWGSLSTQQTSSCVCQSTHTTCFSSFLFFLLHVLGWLQPNLKSKNLAYQLRVLKT